MHKCDTCVYKGEHSEQGFRAEGVCTKEHDLLKAVLAYRAKECPFAEKKETPMTDREKLIEILLEADCEIGILCDGCGARPEEEVFGNIADHLLAHGVTVKEMQKPLALEELSYEAEMYWVENEDGCFPVLLWDKSYCYSSFSQFGTEQDAFLNNVDYGKTWRCWAEKPTEEERKAAGWEM